MGSKTRSAGRVPPDGSGRRGFRGGHHLQGRRTGVHERFRRHATAKLAKIEKLDQKAIRIDVEISTGAQPAPVGTPRTRRADDPVARAGHPRGSGRGRPLHGAGPRRGQTGGAAEGGPASGARDRRCGHGGCRRWASTAGAAMGQRRGSSLKGSRRSPAAPRMCGRQTLADGQTGRAAGQRATPADGTLLADGDTAAGERRLLGWRDEASWVTDSGMLHPHGRRRPAGRAGEVPCRRTDDHRPGIAGDGTRRPRFFALPRQECRASVVYRRCGYDYGVIRLVEE